jgi:hypothetical protein
MMLITTICVALSAAGLAIAFVWGRRRRFRRAVRIAAYALIPVGLAMAGLADLVAKIADAVGDWAAGLVFSPVVWAGFAVLALSAVLFAAVRAADRRAAADGGRGAVGRRSDVLPGKAARPDHEVTGRGHRGKDRGKDRSDGGPDDFREIEEILRRRGI